ncbi:uncharacterized protein LOC131243250 [Magnolia sinica]|uniref:uncharacterized protein LOC131243250 n=1 Tax=Magnolia sinica TaxID=86752 RepID=UPI0026587798|nr:uncharacterized protein LOC131243250 [Magnolia sinica]
MSKWFLPRSITRDLRNVGKFEGEEEEDKGLNRTRSWRRLKRASSRKRPRLRIPGLRRLLRRKARLVSATWTKMWKRLKESRNHIGDPIAGNYMFMECRDRCAQHGKVGSFKNVRKN